MLLSIWAAFVIGVAPALAANSAAPPPAAPAAVPVTPDNFPRAETDLHFSGLVKEAGLGKFRHQRAPAALDKQRAARVDRDTLTSDAVFDLAAGPVTITLPDAGKRFLSMQVIDEDGYTPEVVYGAGSHTLAKDQIGARYVEATIRIFVDADDPKDIDAVKALQDAVTVDQPGGPGAFQPPNWDASTQAEVRTGLVVLALTLPDAKGMFGAKGKVDPVRRLIGSATAWGGLPEEDGLFLDVTPDRNDGRTVYRLRPQGRAQSTGSGRSASITREAFSSRTRATSIRSIPSPPRLSRTDPPSSSSAAATARSPTACRRRPDGIISSASTAPAPKSSAARGRFPSRRRRLDARSARLRERPETWMTVWVGQY